MKAKINLQVISSAGEPHDVYFDFSDNKLVVFCNCQAGIHGKLCKHKTGLLDGDSSILFDKSDQNRLEQIHELVRKTKYVEILSSYNLLKKEIEEAQKKERKFREQIEHALKSGIEIFE